MNNRQLLATGAIGTVITAVCCFTSVLVIGLGALGLSAWLGGLDYVLIPALVFFAGMAIFALYRERRNPTAEKR